MQKRTLQELRADRRGSQRDIRRKRNVFQHSEKCPLVTILEQETTTNPWCLLRDYLVLGNPRSNPTWEGWGSVPLLKMS